MYIIRAYLKTGNYAIKKKTASADKIITGDFIMFVAMLAGYLVATVAFYSYIVATAQEEPKEKAVTVIDMTEWQRSRDTDMRRAA